MKTPIRLLYKQINMLIEASLYFYFSRYAYDMHINIRNVFCFPPVFQRILPPPPPWVFCPRIISTNGYCAHSRILPSPSQRNIRFIW